jgi:hypothetical protein
MPIVSKCHKAFPISSKKRNNLKKYTIQNGQNTLYIPWEDLLHYNKFIIDVFPNTNGNTNKRIYLSGYENQKNDFIKIFNDQNCVKIIPPCYIYAEFIIKLIGNVTVDVYKFSNSQTIETQTNDFYRVDPDSTETMTYHFHKFFTLSC